MSSRIDPYSLHLFVVAVREGAIARAAARENIAPSALSRRLSDLERTLGVSLLARSARGIEPTEAGKIALALGARIEDELQSLVHRVRAEKGAMSGTVRLFANSSSVVGFLPERLKAFAARHPFVHVALEERMSADVLRACLEGSADIGVCTGVRASPGLDSWLFAIDPVMVVMPRRHPLAASAEIRFVEVLGHSLVGVQSGGSLDRLLHDRALKAGRPLRLAVSVSSIDAVCRMVEAGLGIAVIPKSGATAYAGSSRFVRRPLAEPWARRELRLYVPRKKPRARAVEALIDALRSRARPIANGDEGRAAAARRLPVLPS